jgi:hypothetical protein
MFYESRKSSGQGYPLRQDSGIVLTAMLVARLSNFCILTTTT